MNQTTNQVQYQSLLDLIANSFHKDAEQKKALRMATTPIPDVIKDPLFRIELPCGHQITYQDYFVTYTVPICLATPTSFETKEYFPSQVQQGRQITEEEKSQYKKKINGIFVPNAKYKNVLAKQNK